MHLPGQHSQRGSLPWAMLRALSAPDSGLITRVDDLMREARTASLLRLCELLDPFRGKLLELARADVEPL